MDKQKAPRADQDAQGTTEPMPQFKPARQIVKRVLTDLAEQIPVFRRHLERERR